MVPREGVIWITGWRLILKPRNSPRLAGAEAAFRSVEHWDFSRQV